VGDGGVGKSAFYTRVVENTFKPDDKALVEQVCILFLSLRVSLTDRGIRR
jgi:GTPase SAR1 family protein